MKKVTKPSEKSYEIFVDGCFNLNIPENFNFLLGYVQPNNIKPTRINEPTIKPFLPLRYAD